MSGNVHQVDHSTENVQQDSMQADTHPQQSRDTELFLSDSSLQNQTEHIAHIGTRTLQRFSSDEAFRAFLREE